MDALSSILNQVFTGVFGGAARTDPRLASDMRAARLRINIRSMLAHNSNTLTVLAAYLARANATENLSMPPAAHPVLPPQQAAALGRPMISLKELTRAVVHAIDSCTQEDDGDFIGALSRVSGVTVTDKVARRLRELMANAREEAAREERGLRRALRFLQNRHRFIAGAEGAEEVDEQEMRLAREAALNPNEYPEDTPHRVREIAEWLIGEREAAELQGPQNLQERSAPATGGAPAYEFQALAGLAFVLLAAQSVALTARFQTAVEEQASGLLSAFLSDLSQEGSNFPATGVRC
jgi:hypothetical protein